jgi:DNA-binding beta-propeller fold protein YncE
VSLLAGSGAAAYANDPLSGATAAFSSPIDVALSADGRTLFVADSGNHTIRKISLDGTVSTVAGMAGQSGSADGDGAAARFCGPKALAVGGDGAIYVADTENHLIRKISPAGAVTTLAGTAGSPGSQDGTGSSASFFRPLGITVDGSGNVYVADTGNHVVRQIDLTTGLISTIAGRATPGFDADGEVAVETRLFSPYAVDVSADGRVMIADTGNHCVRELLADGRLETRMGVCGELGGADEGDADGPVHLNWPGCARFAPDGSLYVCDMRNHVVRRTPLPDL